MPTTSQTPVQRPAAPHALLSGGGSGGHVFPGLAVAVELAERGWTVGWAGRASGMEARLVGERGIPFYPLPARPVVGRGPAGKALAAATLVGAAWAAQRLVRRLDSRVVVGTGGYVSAPAVVGGRLAARPVLLLEPNAEAGTANRWLSRWASEAAVGYPESGAQLRCPVRVTGVPVRREFFAAAAALPTPPPLRLLVLGGSQGARQLNELLPAALGRLAGSLPTLKVVHQAGERHRESTARAYAAALGAGRVEVVGFLPEVAAAMAASHLVVSRSGAITLAEICAAGRPSLLVPLAIAGAHQLANARALAQAGAAELLPSPEATADALAERLGLLLGDPSRLASMAAAARRLARPDAAATIAGRVAELGGGG